MHHLKRFRIIVSVPWIACAALLTATGVTSVSVAQPAPERLVHRFLAVAISPDSTLVASVEGEAPRSGNLPIIRELVIRNTASKAATTIGLPCGRVAECWPGSLAWTPDGKHLTFTLRTPGSHARSIYSVAPDGSQLTRLLEFSGTLIDLRYAPDGRLAVLATENARKEIGATEAGAGITGDADEKPAEQRIAILDRGSLHWSSPADLFVYEYDWLPQGNGFVGTAAPGDGDNNWWVAKLYAFGAADAAGRVIYAPTDNRQQIARPIVSRDGRTVAFIGGIMSDFGSTGGDVYTLPVSGGAPKNITPDMHASATSLAWSCTGRLRAHLLVGDKNEIVEFGGKPQDGAPHVLWSGSESLHGRDAGLTSACPSDTSATVRESFTAPPEIATGAMGRWRDLTSVNTGMTMPVRVQSLSWKSDGLDVQGWLLLPDSAESRSQGQGKLPMITIVHGGPASAVIPQFAGPSLMRTLLENGYALFRPNPRGSYGQGERFTAANVRDLGYGDLRDILAGIDAAEKAAPIDDSRLGITGNSYGGFMTMWAVTQTHRFNAAVASAGLSNWTSYYGENGIDQWMLPYFGASVYEDPKVYERSSPINFIRNVRTPTFEYVGERDIECPAPQTQEFWHALKALGVPTASVIYAGEGHGLRDPEHLADAEQRTLEWFKKYLAAASRKPPG